MRPHPLRRDLLRRLDVESQRVAIKRQGGLDVRDGNTRRDRVRLHQHGRAGGRASFPALARLLTRRRRAEIARVMISSTAVYGSSSRPAMRAI